MRYDSGAMKRFTARVMEAAGLSEEESRVFADSLIRADMRGISSHGLTRLATYARRVEQGWWPAMWNPRSCGTAAPCW